MIVAQHGFIGLGLVWIVFLALIVVYLVGVGIGWLCASCLRREPLHVRWFDWLLIVLFMFPAFGIWLLILRENHQIYDSGPTGVLTFSIGLVLGIGIIFGIVLFLIIPGHRKRFSN